MSLLTKEGLQQAVNLRTERVEVPEWGGEVIVRELTGKERDLFEESFIVVQGKKRSTTLENMRAKLVAKSIVDEKGNRLLTDKDAEWLGSRSAAALDRVFEVAQRLSGISDADVEDLTKNSSPGQSEDSTSASPGTLAAPSTSSSTVSAAAS